MSQSSYGERQQQEELSPPEPGGWLSSSILPVFMSYFTGGFCQWGSRSRLPNSSTWRPCRAEEHVAPQASAAGSLVSPGFLPHGWQSCLVTRASVKSLGHLGSPMPSQGCSPTAGCPLLARFTFCLGCWVSWHHPVQPCTSDRATHSCVIPEKCLCHLFVTTSIPAGVPQFSRLITSGVWLLVGSEQSSKCQTCSFLAALEVLCFLSYPG